MKYSTKYSKLLEPSDIRKFVLATLKKDVFDMARSDEGIIEFCVDSYFGDSQNLISFLVDDFCISQMNSNSTINSQNILDSKWRLFMTVKFGKAYERDLQHSVLNKEELFIK